jgi:hypothetical protein
MRRSGEQSDPDPIARLVEASDAGGQGAAEELFTGLHVVLDDEASAC